MRGSLPPINPERAPTLASGAVVDVDREGGAVARLDIAAPLVLRVIDPDVVDLNRLARDLDPRGVRAERADQ